MSYIGLLVCRMNPLINCRPSPSKATHLGTGEEISLLPKKRCMLQIPIYFLDRYLFASGQHGELSVRAGCALGTQKVMRGMEAEHKRRIDARFRSIPS